jgi:hypothetical protein
MSDTYSIKVDGCEVGRVSGEGWACGKKLDKPELMGGDLVDDPRMLKIVRDGKTVAVFYVSAAENVTIEKLEESA